MTKLVIAGTFVSVPGDLRIDDAVDEGIKLAQQESTQVNFIFNGVLVQIDSDTTHAEASQKYWDEISKQSTAPQR